MSFGGGEYGEYTLRQRGGVWPGVRWRQRDGLSRGEVAAVARRGKEGLLSGEEKESGGGGGSSGCLDKRERESARAMKGGRRRREREW